MGLALVWHSLRSRRPLQCENVLSLSHYLLIIALFSIDNAVRNFPVIFPLLAPLTCSAREGDVGVNPTKSRIMNLVDSWLSIQGILWEEARCCERHTRPVLGNEKNLHWSLWEKEDDNRNLRAREERNGGFRFFPHASLTRSSLLFIYFEENILPLPATKANLMM